MTEQTQKIWEAFCGELIQEPTDDMKEALASALRALADQVLEDWNEETYDKILASATELEAL